MTDEYFMEKALAHAQNALSAGEFPVGCVIADEKNIKAAGFRRGSGGQHPNEIDHAEILALRALYDIHALAHPEKLTVYCTMEPCLMCFGAILISGIRRIVYAYEDKMGGGTTCGLSGASSLYREKPVEVVPHVLRRQSLVLFQEFFSRPENNYWKNSLLAEYTMAQK